MTELKPHVRINKPDELVNSNKRKLEDKNSDDHKAKKSNDKDAKETDLKRVEKEDEQEDSNLESFPKDLLITLEDIGTINNLPELSMRLNKYIKHILKQWESEESSKELLLDTKKSLFPMLVKLRKAILDSDALTSLLTIMYYVQRANYLKANESYMELSIGNVAWPIGVVNVSIHARSGQVKLNKGGANIMIDETTRKWITAIKRLITFKETHKST